MATCKDCLHYQACRKFNEIRTNVIDESKRGAENLCELYADKSRFVELPCKVGDRLYQIVEMPRHKFVSEFPIIVEPQQIIYRNIMGHYSCIPFEDFGKTVFLTREEAEAALAERKNE